MLGGLWLRRSMSESNRDRSDKSPADPISANGRVANSNRKSRLVALGAGGALVALVLAAALALATRTGMLGFIDLLAILLGAIAALILYRKVDRGLRHLIAVSRKTERRLAELERRIARNARDLRSLRSDLSEIDKSVDKTSRLLSNLRREIAPATLAALAASDPGTALTPSQASPAAATSDLLDQVQAISSLHALVPMPTISPAMGGWAASADVVAELVYDVLSRRPSLIVECGSGVSTLWLAATVRHFQLDTKIVSLEHDEAFADDTRARLVSAGLEDLVDIRVAPLTETSVDGAETTWYDPARVDDLTNIGLLFVDGPPETTGPLARRPAVPVLIDRLAPTATIIMDDSKRAGEREIAALWQAYLPDFEYRHLPLQKGAIRFRRTGPALAPPRTAN